jgi:hypothetical protein
MKENTQTLILIIIIVNLISREGNNISINLPGKIREINGMIK